MDKRNARENTNDMNDMSIQKLPGQVCKKIKENNSSAEKIVLSFPAQELLNFKVYHENSER